MITVHATALQLWEIQWYLLIRCRDMLFLAVVVDLSRAHRGCCCCSFFGSRRNMPQLMSEVLLESVGNRRADRGRRAVAMMQQSIHQRHQQNQDQKEKYFALRISSSRSCEHKRSILADFQNVPSKCNMLCGYISGRIGGYYCTCLVPTDCPRITWD